MQWLISPRADLLGILGSVGVAWALYLLWATEVMSTRMVILFWVFVVDWLVGLVMASVGGTWSRETVMVLLEVTVLGQVAVMTMGLAPACRAMPGADQLAPPAAVPLAPVA